MRLAFRADNGAVTSPLGNGMTIAIAILLAVGVAIMVRVFTEQNEDTPPVTFSKDEATDSLQVLHAEAGLRRSDFQVRLSVAGDVEVGAPVPAGGDALAPNVFASLGGATDGPADGELVTGNQLYFCATSAASAVHVEVRHVGSNTVILREDFLALGACPA